MIPENITEVSTEWLSDVLNQPLAGFIPHQIGQGVGIMGDIFRVELQYAEERPTGPSTVVVKLPSSFPENREQGVALGMFEAEVRFYNELANEMSAGLPKIYRADIETGTARFVIVMEDLSGLTMVDQHVGVTLDQAQAALRVLAAAHAVWWDNAEDNRINWIPSMVGPRIEFVDGLLVQLLEPFAEKFTAHLPPGTMAVYEAFAGNYLNITKTIAARSPWTLVHQDFRVENMLFGNDRVAVIDWQGIGRGPGAYDLSYFLGGSMESELRRQHEPALLSTYHDALKHAGVENYDYEALEEDYGLAHFMGGLATSMVVGGGMDLSNDRGMQLCVTMASRHGLAALDHGGADRIRQVAAQS